MLFVDKERIHHWKHLEEVEFILVYTGQQHYLGAGNKNHNCTLICIHQYHDCITTAHNCTLSVKADDVGRFVETNRVKRIKGFEEVGKGRPNTDDKEEEGGDETDDGGQSDTVLPHTPKQMPVAPETRSAKKAAQDKERLEAVEKVGDRKWKENEPKFCSCHDCTSHDHDCCSL